MNERRSFYRIRTIARVGLRPLAEDQVEDARVRVRSRSRDIGNPLGVSEDVLTSAEQHASLALLQQILFAIDRLNRRVDEMARLTLEGMEDGFVRHAPGVISLSGAGFSGTFAQELHGGELVEAELDMWETGLPLIACLGRVVHAQKIGKNTSTALNFEELLAEDRERIVQLSIRSQSQDLRAQRRESR